MELTTRQIDERYDADDGEIRVRLSRADYHLFHCVLSYLGRGRADPGEEVKILVLGLIQTFIERLDDAGLIGTDGLISDDVN